MGLMAGKFGLLPDSFHALFLVFSFLMNRVIIRIVSLFLIPLSICTEPATAQAAMVLKNPTASSLKRHTASSHFLTDAVVQTSYGSKGPTSWYVSRRVAALVLGAVSFFGSSQPTTLFGQAAPNEARQYIANVLFKPDGALLNEINRQIVVDAGSGLIHSHPDNPYSQGETVVYDQGREIERWIESGQIDRARKAADFIRLTPQIVKRGWIKIRKPDGTIETKVQDGWIVNVIRGTQLIEPLTDVGPNAYLGYAFLHLYRVTGERVYLDFALQRMRLAKELQNEIEGDKNYGGIRMGPDGDPAEATDQHGNLEADSPSRYHSYNTENTIDVWRLYRESAAYLRMSDRTEDLAEADDLERRMRLIEGWLVNVYDNDFGAFFEGTIEPSGDAPETFVHKMLVKEGDPADLNNPPQVIPILPGERNTIPVHPLDASHLVASAFGPAKFNRLFGQNAFDRLIQVTESDYMVRAANFPDGEPADPEDPSGSKDLVLFDAVPRAERARMITYSTEKSVYRDRPERTAETRPALGTIEWMAWYNLSLLAAMEEAAEQNDLQRVKDLVRLYNRNVHNSRRVFRNGPVVGQGPYAVHMALTEMASAVRAIIVAANDVVFYTWLTIAKGFRSAFPAIAGTALETRRDDHLTAPPNPWGAFYIPSPPLTSDPTSVTMDLAGKLIPPSNAAIVLNRAWPLLDTLFNRPEAKDNWIAAHDAIENEIIQGHRDWLTIAQEQQKVAEELNQLNLNGLSINRAAKLQRLRDRAAVILATATDTTQVHVGQRLQTLAAEIENLQRDFESYGGVDAFGFQMIDQLFNAQPFQGRAGIAVRAPGQLASPNPLQRYYERMLTSIYRTHANLYDVAAGYFIQAKANALLERYFGQNLPEKELYHRRAVIAAKEIIANYGKAQAFDLRGWFWQIFDSLRIELGPIFEEAMKELEKENKISPADALAAIQHSDATIEQIKKIHADLGQPFGPIQLYVPAAGVKSNASTARAGLSRRFWSVLRMNVVVALLLGTLGCNVNLSLLQLVLIAFICSALATLIAFWTDSLKPKVKRDDRRAVTIGIAAGVLVTAGATMVSRWVASQPSLRERMPKLALAIDAQNPPSHHKKSVDYTMMEDDGKASDTGGMGTVNQQHDLYSRYSLRMHGKTMPEHLPQHQVAIFEKGPNGTWASPLGENSDPEDKKRLRTWSWENARQMAHGAVVRLLHPYTQWEYPKTPLGTEVTLRRFSPLVPKNVEASSLPVEITQAELYNNTDQEKEVSVLVSVANFAGWQTEIKDPYYVWKKNVTNQYSNLTVNDDTRFNGLVMGARTNSVAGLKGQIAILADTSQNDILMTYRAQFDANQGEDVWKSFSEHGELANIRPKINENSELAGAIALKVTLKPRERRTLTYAIATDFPDDERNEKIFHPHYAGLKNSNGEPLYGSIGVNAVALASRALENHETWSKDIEAWQSKILNHPRLPDEAKTMLINELYFLIAGGTLFTDEGKLYFMEGRDPQLLNTSDVWFYTPLLCEIFPELEKGIMREMARGVLWQDNTVIKYHGPFVTGDAAVTRERYGGDEEKNAAAIQKLGAGITVPGEFEGVLKVPGAPLHHFDDFVLGPVSEKVGNPMGRKINRYLRNHNTWKDLSPKFVLMLWRAYAMDGKKDKAFLNDTWKAVVAAL